MGLYGCNRKEADISGHYITRKFGILTGQFVIVVTTFRAMTLQSTTLVYRVGDTRNAHKLLVVIRLEKRRETGYLNFGKIN